MTKGEVLGDAEAAPRAWVVLHCTVARAHCPHSDCPRQAQPILEAGVCGANLLVNLSPGSLGMTWARIGANVHGGPCIMLGQYLFVQ